MSYINSNLSFSECERIAYANGDFVNAEIFAEVAEFQDEIDGFDDILDEAKAESFELGRLDGLGVNASAEIHSLQTDVQRLNVTNEKLRKLLYSFETRLAHYHDEMKTVAGRKRTCQRICSDIRSSGF